MDNFKEILQEIRKFNHERDWEQFHNPKDLAIAINIESSELLERFLWKSNDEVDLKGIERELADVLNYCFMLADKLDLNISDIMFEKIQENANKYPVGKAKGNSDKYNKL